MAIDYDLIFGVADYDPCATLLLLRPAYMKLLLEGTVQEITFRDRTVRYAKADLSGWRALIARLESECAAKTGAGRPRFAIKAGYRRDLGS